MGLGSCAPVTPPTAPCNVKEGSAHCFSAGGTHCGTCPSDSFLHNRNFKVQHTQSHPHLHSTLYAFFP